MSKQITIAIIYKKIIQSATLVGNYIFDFGKVIIISIQAMLMVSPTSICGYQCLQVYTTFRLMTPERPNKESAVTVMSRN